MTPAKRRPSRVTPSPKKASTVEALVARPLAPKGRVPVAAATSKAARRQQAADDRVKADAAKAAAAKADSKAELVDADGNVVEGPPKPRYGAGAVLIAFLAGQILSIIAYSVVQSVTDYDFAVPPVSAPRWARPRPSRRTGQALAIGVPPPLWATALMQLPLWIGIGLIPVWFVVKRGNGVVADLGLRMKAIDVPVGLAIGVVCQLVMVPVLYWRTLQDHRRQGRLGRRPRPHRSGHRPVLDPARLRGGRGRGAARRGDLLPWLRPADLRAEADPASGDPCVGDVLRRLARRSCCSSRPCSCSA